MADATLLPPNATALERAVATACIPATDLPVPLREAWNPTSCPAPLLPWLAWAWSVDAWDTTQMDEAAQRAAIASSLDVKRHKGTAGAMRRAIDALGATVRVQEWFAQAPQGEPYTYRLHVDVTQSGVSLPQLQQLLRTAQQTANLRSHLSDVTVTVTSEAAITWAAAACSGHEISVAYVPPLAYSDGSPAFGLINDALLNGEDNTVAAIQALHACIASLDL
ncbi:phage tail protein I [Azohydromonas lata]|uniref:Phage tail protein I n=1 Tax=Azohydromonas lata TaxID=45677 RepID=A0ABU5IEM9_9BURK|nr:phage tail protein I [Azohydromonas lata]MDZ5456996.1 phage tail protein I [Azohydromonas lata]